ncbi:MAG: hypothetical protein K9N51_10845, partial [Candidatus Pacebacteria bacterium]|nr:hypothetical protein [Candidatus Paceibacterota bacterium]
MNVSKSQTPECPSISDLSAWHDGEDCPAVDKHIQECRRCKHIVDFFGRVDQTLADSMQPPSGLNQRIVERCTQMSTTPL